MAQTLTVTEAARNVSEVVSQVFDRRESMNLTREGKIVARLIPAPDVDASTGRQVLEVWKTRPRLTPEETVAFAEDIEKSRQSLNRPPSELTISS